MLEQTLHSNMSQFKHEAQRARAKKMRLYIPICLNLNFFCAMFFLSPFFSLHSNMSQFKLAAAVGVHIATIYLYIPICLNLNLEQEVKKAKSEYTLHSNMSQFKPFV